ncbi:ComEC/Rec2 family competence protein [Candidatus Azambacteria bacterium]|nr:ComEC/Rec2 family competence protein [Candidatus Azambacteria bacterium]
MAKSKIFALFLLSFIGGVFAYSTIKIPPALIGGIFVFSFSILATAVLKRNKPDFSARGGPVLGWKIKIIFGFCLLALAFGFWRSFKVFNYAGSLAGANFVIGEKINFSGKIVEEPDRRSDFAQYVLENGALGRVLVKTKLYPEYFYGDILKINGKIESPESRAGESGFDYKNYLAKDGIFLISRYPKIDLIERPAVKNFYGRLLEIKKSFVGVINKILLEPQASFLAALLVGARRTLPADLTDAFNITGTSHIVAISGYNISIISVMLLNFLGYLFLPRRLIFWVAGVCLVLFTLIAGAGASVVRAAVMGGLLILARHEGRLYSITNAIIFAAAVMLFLNPYLLRYDAGFQLSFLATLGLVYLAPHFASRFSRLPNFLSFRDNLAATLSARVATLPVVLFSFNRFSLIAILANVLILPAVPFTMLFGFLAGLTGFISVKIASIFIFPAWLALSYQIWIVKILSSLPFASISL